MSRRTSGVRLTMMSANPSVHRYASSSIRPSDHQASRTDGGRKAEATRGTTQSFPLPRPPKTRAERRSMRSVENRPAEDVILRSDAAVYSGFRLRFLEIHWRSNISLMTYELRRVILNVLRASRDPIMHCWCDSLSCLSLGTR
jgi:hypothetical protein